MAYADLLRDPRWQRKRLEVMADAGFACEFCHATDRTLNVHHPKYVRGRMPWEYTRAELECLCEECHKDEHGIGEKAREEIRRARLTEAYEQAAKSLELRRLKVKEKWPWDYARLMECEAISDQIKAAATSAEKDVLMRRKMAIRDELREKGEYRAAIQFHKGW